jgi:putative ABC transport system permease protein
VKLFTAESLMLTLLGCLSGLFITLAVRFGINVAHISYTPPNSASPVPLLVDLDLSHGIFTLILMVAVGTLAAYLPARRASKQAIIDALGHV